MMGQSKIKFSLISDFGPCEWWSLDGRKIFRDPQWHDIAFDDSPIGNKR